MAKIRVNASEWSNLSTTSQQQITDILEETGLLKDTDSIKPDFNLPLSALAIRLPQLSTSTCQALCTTAEAAASAMCMLLTDPVSRVVCITVAKAGGEACRNGCKGKGAPLPTTQPAPTPRTP